MGSSPPLRRRPPVPAADLVVGGTLPLTSLESWRPRARGRGGRGRAPLPPEAPRSPPEKRVLLLWVGVVPALIAPSGAVVSTVAATRVPPAPRQFPTAGVTP